MNTLLDETDMEIKEDLPDKSEKEPLRLGRRESEPHSFEVTYIFNVLWKNFPESRTFWDLHHYFKWGIKNGHPV